MTNGQPQGRWRSASIQIGVPLITAIAGAKAAVGAIKARRAKEMGVRALQDYLKPDGKMS